MKNPKWTFLAALLPAVLLFSPALYADDDDDDDDDKKKKFKKGIIEIDQRSAEKGRITSSDGKGFPVTLDKPGSYRLVSNLNPPDPGIDAIEITAENVTLDLNGFSIIGPGGSGGTGVTAIDQSNVNVVNGSVIGMGGHGLELDIAAYVDRVNALDNGGDGVVTQGGSTITNTTANRNGGNGINSGIGCSVMDSKANRNGADGISTRQRCTITNNTANVNDGDGIENDGRSVVIGNAVSENQGYGLLLGAGSGFVNNVASGNNGRAPSVRNAQVAGGRELGSNICGNQYC